MIGHFDDVSRKIKEGSISKGTIIQEGHVGQKDPMVGTKAQPNFATGAE